MHSAVRLADLLDRRRAEVPGLSAVAGFDGFVDELISVVGERRGPGEWTPLGSMAELGAILTATAGGSGRREIVVRGQDAGGCAVKLGDGLATLGVVLDYFGTVGQPRHPAFAAFAARCRTCTAWGTSYGRTLAFDFGDGTFCFPAVEQVGELTPDLLVEATADGAFARACAGAGLISFNNWTQSHVTACWRWLQEHVLAGLEHRPWLYLDLVDPSGRSASDVQAMLGAVAVFERTCRTVLSLNLAEVQVIVAALGLPAVAASAEDLCRGASAIRARLGITQVVIHHRAFNAVATATGALAVASGPPCAQSRKSTDASERFNAGYCLGLLLGLDGEDCCHLGSATAGCFIRSARSADLEEVIAFLRAWAAGDAGRAC